MLIRSTEERARNQAADWYTSTRAAVDGRTATAFVCLQCHHTRLHGRLPPVAIKPLTCLSCSEAAGSTIVVMPQIRFAAVNGRWFLLFIPSTRPFYPKVDDPYDPETMEQSLRFLEAADQYNATCYV